MTAKKYCMTLLLTEKQERWTLSQLKQSAAGQGYIQQKMRENAEQSKQIETQKAQLAQQQQAILKMYKQMQQGNYSTYAAIKGTFPK